MPSTESASGPKDRPGKALGAAHKTSQEDQFNVSQKRKSGKATVLPTKDPNEETSARTREPRKVGQSGRCAKSLHDDPSVRHARAKTDCSIGDMPNSARVLRPDCANSVAHG